MTDDQYTGLIARLDEFEYAMRFGIASLGSMAVTYATVLLLILILRRRD